MGGGLTQSTVHTVIVMFLVSDDKELKAGDLSSYESYGTDEAVLLCQLKRRLELPS